MASHVGKKSQFFGGNAVGRGFILSQLEHDTAQNEVPICVSLIYKCLILNVNLINQIIMGFQLKKGSNSNKILIL